MVLEAVLVFQSVAKVVMYAVAVFSESIDYCNMNILFLKLEKTVMPYLSAMSEFRDSVREHARNLKATDILKVCDNLRDEILPNMGVRLEDREGM